jgi:hypothetical protein
VSKPGQCFKIWSLLQNQDIAIKLKYHFKNLNYIKIDAFRQNHAITLKSGHCIKIMVSHKNPAIALKSGHCIKIRALHQNQDTSKCGRFVKNNSTESTSRLALKLWIFNQKSGHSI